jgi:hypothetical protein
MFGDLWRDLEEDAIRFGLTLDYFWTLNPKQWNKYVKVFNEEEERRVKEIDTMNYLLGKYIAFAFNDPASYPSKPFSENVHEEVKEMSVEDMERQAKYNTIKMGGVVNDS